MKTLIYTTNPIELLNSNIKLTIDSTFKMLSFNTGSSNKMRKN